ncbi:hypothetical protein SmJEL517_g05573 [Synchytrium microbalum]|uniref:Ubiquitin carboxyl-terminal hydrolase n=1 Tax=Synchytrium microbalum TaxID=1806994 RepID=A0A507BYV3_9FUNG|nr:uncharacterized protein SmJEL517_g05573 [Synchytrium microbalum]TPX30994.1 hypothetical protein SmJEL517_g05573 [Synchytrium microbalum]
MHDIYNRTAHTASPRAFPPTSGSSKLVQLSSFSISTSKAGKTSAASQLHSNFSPPRPTRTPSTNTLHGQNNKIKPTTATVVASRNKPSSVSSTTGILIEIPSPPLPRTFISPASSKVSLIRAARYSPQVVPALPSAVSAPPPAVSLSSTPKPIVVKAKTPPSKSNSVHENLVASPQQQQSSLDSIWEAIMQRFGVVSASSAELVGLRNLGNTCFMASIIQCLNGITPLVGLFLSGGYKRHINRDNPLGSKGLVTDSFADLVNTLWTSKEKVAAPSRFKSTISSFAPQFQGYEQHDAQEFLAFLLDAIHEDLNDARKGRQSIVKDEEDDESLPDETSTTYEATMYLSLPVPSRPFSTKPVTLDDCLTKFHEEENLDGSDCWFCSKCKQKRSATKKLSIQKLPSVLLVHLKRFSFQGPFGSKVDTVVDFPLENLNLTKYTQRVDQAPIYDLVAVSCHQGSLSGGHYTALVKRKREKSEDWYLFDDARVSKVDPASIVSRSAYILFYLRRPNKASL